MAYIDTKYLFKCETCRHYTERQGCNTFCDSGECYSPNMNKIPTADVVPREEVAKIFEEIDILGTYNPTLYADLKKKYTEDSTDGKRKDR